MLPRLPPEAINILASDGFATKLSGRSARIVNLTEDDVVNLYELRAALEGLAARVAATKNADVTRLQAALDTMRDAASGNRNEDLLDGDLQFHLELCNMSGNPYIIEHARSGRRRRGQPAVLQTLRHNSLGGGGTSPGGDELQLHATQLGTGVYQRPSVEGWIYLVEVDCDLL